MANPYTSLHYHLVFSTKERQHFIMGEAKERLWAFIGGIARNHGLKALCVGGTEDHIHVLLMVPPTMTPSKMVQLVKGGSSRWMHETFPRMRQFAWQDGYGAFTVGKSQVPEIMQYIQQQAEHHRGKTFQEEYLASLKRHEIEYDERYVW